MTWSATHSSVAPAVWGRLRRIVRHTFFYYVSKASGVQIGTPGNSPVGTRTRPTKRESGRTRLDAGRPRQSPGLSCRTPLVRDIRGALTLLRTAAQRFHYHPTTPTASRNYVISRDNHTFSRAPAYRNLSCVVVRSPVELQSQARPRLEVVLYQ